jgi:hypothetical protein
MPLKVVAQNTLPVADIAGRQVTLELVRTEDFSPVAWPNESVTLIVEDVEVNPGDTIPKLLEARGIVADNESYTLLYDLSPDLNNPQELAPHSKYKFPRVVGGQVLNKSLKEKWLVLITIDQNLKFKLANKSRTMRLLAARFGRIGKHKFNDPKTSKSTKRYVKDLARWYTLIHQTIAQRTAKPIRRIRLEQIVNDAESMNRLLSRAVNRKYKIRRSDCKQILTIHQDIEAIVDKWNERMGLEQPDSDSQYEVEVIISGKDPCVRNLRVYYVIAGHYSEPPTDPPVNSSSFNGLGRRVSEVLPADTNFRIWVAKDGEPGKRLTPPKLIWVNRKLTVELSLE